MKIPKSFKLMGQTINVEKIKTLSETDDLRGLASYRGNKIIINDSGLGIHPETHAEQTFCHELMHFLYFFGGYEDDKTNEAKVEMMANLLHQALSTMEYGSIID